MLKCLLKNCTKQENCSLPVTGAIAKLSASTKLITIATNLVAIGSQALPKHLILFPITFMETSCWFDWWGAVFFCQWLCHIIWAHWTWQPSIWSRWLPLRWICYWSRCFPPVWSTLIYEVYQWIVIRRPSSTEITKFSKIYFKHSEKVLDDLPVSATSATMAKWLNREMDAVLSGTFESRRVQVKLPTGKMDSKAIDTWGAIYDLPIVPFLVLHLWIVFHGQKCKWQFNYFQVLWMC